MNKGYVVWFTGLSGSGKSTLANALAKILKASKVTYEIIDGDDFRNKIHPDLCFTPKDIKVNNKKILEYCLSIIDKKDFILVPVIAPFRSIRSKVKKILGDSYIEVYCKISLEEAIKMDTKGLYKKALTGKIDNLIGFSKNVPYEEPENPNLIIDTKKLNVNQSVNKIINYIKNVKDGKNGKF